MSTLKERVVEDMKSAMRSKEELRLSTIRLLMAGIKQREVDERITLEDTHVLEVINKMIKQRKDSISQYEAAARNDLADREKKEIEFLTVYLPQQMTEQEIEAAVAQAITATGSTSIKDMGKVMGYLKPKVTGRADMTVVSNKIKAKLSA